MNCTQDMKLMLLTASSSSIFEKLRTDVKNTPSNVSRSDKQLIIVQLVDADLLWPLKIIIQECFPPKNAHNMLFIT